MPKGYETLNQILLSPTSSLLHHETTAEKMLIQELMKEGIAEENAREVDLSVREPLMGEESLQEDEILMEQQDDVGSMITPLPRTETKED